MQNLRQKEFRGQDGSVFTVKFSNDVARLEPNGRRHVELSLAAVKWLVSEMEQECSTPQTNMLDVDRVYFFTGEVEEEMVLEAQRELLKMACRLKKRKSMDVPIMTIVFNSPGGCCTNGFALFDTIELIRGMGVKVVGVVIGVAFSMAACLLQSCDVRLVSNHSRVMIHEVGAELDGKLNEIQTSVKQLVFMNNSQASCFANRNTKEHNDPEFWVRFTDGKDNYLSAQESVELGVADAVYAPLSNFDVSQYV